MKTKFPTILIILLTLSVSILTAHGVRLQVKKDAGDIVVKAEYDGGSVINAAAVTIRYETDTMAAYIHTRGKTDQNGIYRFTPDAPGQWTITIDDGMGHIGEDTLLVDTIQKNARETSTKDNKEKKEKKQEKTPFKKQDITSYLLKILLAVGLILLITFILNRWQKSQESK